MLSFRLAARSIRRCSSYHRSERVATEKRRKLPRGPSFQEFLAATNFQSKAVAELRKTPVEAHPYITDDTTRGDGLKVFLDVYGCQMNMSDTEVVWSILENKGYEKTDSKEVADVILIITCSIRENSEAKIWKRLVNFQNKRRTGVYKESLKVGLLGCMAERLKDKMLTTPQKLVDVVAGPDAYRDLPRLLAVTNHSDASAINVLLSLEETYADVRPSRLNKDSVTGFVSIQRGCDNMCSYCIVPFTRGRERSRPMSTILDEVRALSDQGVKEVTLLGQNVNSYRDDSEASLTVFGPSLAEKSASSVAGFRTVYKPKLGGLRFSDLLFRVSEINPEMRIRFTSPHPKDFPDHVLQLISSTPSICKQLHLPAQSGSSRILEAMRRGYTRKSYLDLVQRVKEVIPDIRLSGDLIAGFCGETDQDFEQTLSLIEAVEYGTLFCYPYSMREKTNAHRKLTDDVPDDVKHERMRQMVEVSHKVSAKLNKSLESTVQTVLIEGDSKRSSDDFQGRTDGNVKVIFPKAEGFQRGDYCRVDITSSNWLNLRGVIDESKGVVKLAAH